MISIGSGASAAFNTTDKYALHPGSSGLTIGPGPGLSFGDVASRSWNADVYTSWEFARSLSLYGRLGYLQTDTRPLFAGASIIPGDPRRQRDGVNYGLGLRYDVTHSLGLRVEYRLVHIDRRGRRQRDEECGACNSGKRDRHQDAGRSKESGHG